MTGSGFDRNASEIKDMWVDVSLSASVAGNMYYDFDCVRRTGNPPTSPPFAPDLDPSRVAIFLAGHERLPVAGESAARLVALGGLPVQVDAILVSNTPDSPALRRYLELGSPVLCDPGLRLDREMIVSPFDDGSPICYYVQDNPEIALSRRSYKGPVGDWQAAFIRKGELFAAIAYFVSQMACRSDKAVAKHNIRQRAEQKNMSQDVFKDLFQAISCSRIELPEDTLSAEPPDGVGSLMRSLLSSWSYSDWRCRYMHDVPRLPNLHASDITDFSAVIAIWNSYIDAAATDAGIAQDATDGIVPGMSLAWDSVAEDIASLADELGIQSAIDAYMAGVPLEDVAV